MVLCLATYDSNVKQMTACMKAVMKKSRGHLEERNSNLLRREAGTFDGAMPSR